MVQIYHQLLQLIHNDLVFFLLSHKIQLHIVCHLVLIAKVVKGGSQLDRLDPRGRRQSEVQRLVYVLRDVVRVDRLALVCVLRILVVFIDDA